MPLQLLALELLKILLENSGPIFRHSERFIAAIKQYLCLSLLKNVTSSVSQAQALTCSIFYTLLVKFRQSLKAEIGVFFPMILLRAVEPAAQGTTPNTSGETASDALRGRLMQMLTQHFWHLPGMPFLSRRAGPCQA